MDVSDSITVDSENTNGSSGYVQLRNSPLNLLALFMKSLGNAIPRNEFEPTVDPEILVASEQNIQCRQEIRCRFTYATTDALDIHLYSDKGVWPTLCGSITASIA